MRFLNFFLLIDRPWGMIKVSIFSFPNFGEFNELLANSVLLSEFLTRKVKIGSLVNPNFFSLNHNSVEVQMIHILFILIYLVLTALKLFKIVKFGLFTSQFTFRVLKHGN